MGLDGNEGEKMARTELPDGLVGIIDGGTVFTCVHCLVKEDEDAAIAMCDDEERYTVLMDYDDWRYQVSDCIKCGTIASAVIP